MSQSTTPTSFDVQDGDFVHHLRINGRFLYDENGVIEASIKPSIPYIAVDYRDERGPVLFRFDRQKTRFILAAHSTPFNIVMLYAGLGNSIFQLAFGLYVEKKTGIDSLFLMGEKCKTDTLFRFNKPNDEQLSVLGTQVDENNDQYMQESFNNYLNVYRGYFQNVKDYVLPVLSKLRHRYKFKDSDLSPKAKTYLDDIKSSESVAVHVRRGDYRNQYNDYIFEEGDVDWYKKALKKLGENVNDPLNNKFFIFSDDIEWCKKSFSFLDRAVFVEGNSDVEDFHLIKSCKHFIVPNSTFSYTAMMLSESTGTKVAMKSWFKDVDRTRAKFHFLFPGVLYI